MSTALKIFSYLPNPRVYKSLIAAELLGLDVEVVGAKPAELGGWLWDANPRPLEPGEATDDAATARRGKRGFRGVLHKTDAFLNAHPFGTVPAAFSPDGEIGVFESNSILRAVVRAASDDQGLYGGGDPYVASRVDSFLDANLVFAREAQVYLLGVDTLREEAHSRMKQAYEFYLDGVESAISRSGAYLAGDQLTIADISFVCDFAQFLREGHYREQLESRGFRLVSEAGADEHPKAFEHLFRLEATEPFKKVMGKYLDWYRAG